MMIQLLAIHHVPKWYMVDCKMQVKLLAIKTT